MSVIFELDATVRTDLGKGASRRLRRQQNLVPAIIYGGNKKPEAITLFHNKVIQSIQQESFYSHLLTLKLGSKKEQVILKNMQRHPYKKTILHMDFQRVSAKEKIVMRIPIHYLNEDKCPGAKEGGIISHHLIDIELRCQANKIPKAIEIDLSTLEMNQAIHLSDLKLSKDIEIPVLAQGDDHNLTIVSVHEAKITKEDPEITDDTDGQQFNND